MEDKKEMNKEPSKPKAVPTPPVDDSQLDRDIESIFGPSAPRAEEPLAQSLDRFIAATARSKVAVVVPLYGYWENTDGFLDDEILEAALNRLHSHAHSLYIILVAEPERLPRSTAQTLAKKFVGGNVKGVRVPVGASYGDYAREGLRVAQEETDASYMVVFNPWVVVQENGLDTIIDRVNLDGNAPVICGYDLRGELTPEQFMAHKANAPRERVMLNFNFLAMHRFVLEMVPPDPAYRTRPYVERDFFQTVASNGFAAVSTERVPMFSFEVPWHEYVPDEFYAEDKAHFSRKWGFTPAGVVRE